jgi:hypothetical protein
MKKHVLATLVLFSCLGISSQVHAGILLTLDNITPSAGSSASKIDGGILQLTDNSLTDPTYQIGSAYSTSTVNVSNFSASFSFQFSGSSAYGPADGIVFVIKNPASQTSGGDGGGLGYGTITTGSGTYSGIPQSVGIEFDNWNNSEVGDPSGNHIGIDTNGTMTSLATLDLSPAFNDAGVWYAWVDFDGSDLSVSVSTTDSKPNTPMLTYTIGDLKTIIDSPTALIGFTGSTGLATQTEQVLSLNYLSTSEPVPEPQSLALLGIGGVLATVGRLKTKPARLAES